jgi:carboxypeptidase C (cathepsin A)
VQSGIQVLIWAGDADWICNWFGGFDVANGIQYSGSSTFGSKAVQNYTVNGKAGGEFKNVDNLSWLRVFGAGHEVPYYRKLSQAGTSRRQIVLIPMNRACGCSAGLYADIVQAGYFLHIDGCKWR